MSDEAGVSGGAQSDADLFYSAPAAASFGKRRAHCEPTCWAAAASDLSTADRIYMFRLQAAIRQATLIGNPWKTHAVDYADINDRGRRSY
jgi:hypothetical protein